MLLKGRDEKTGILDIFVDFVSRCLLVMPHEHHKTHEGKHYTVQKYFDSVDSGSKVVIRFKTPESTYTHMVFSGYATAGALIEVFEDSTRTNDDGNALTIQNRHRESTNTSDFQQVCHTPGGVENGTIMVPKQKMGTSGNPNATAPGENRDANEYILKRDTVYSIEVESEANGTDINIGLDWYETGPTE